MLTKGAGSWPPRNRFWSISILGVLLAIVGLLDVILAVAFIAGIRTISVPSVLTFTPATAYIPFLEVRGLTLGTITVAAAIAITRQRPWAWSYAWMVMGMAILFTLADFILSGANLEYTMVTAAIPAVILVYLSRPDVRQAFGRRANAAAHQDARLFMPPTSRRWLQ
jgi:hypothetical protein